ncbi:uncharacterized protein LOC62_03G003993 [Vanrija pseudolonga]|uniref:Uncharacterized protein n=1 Tax=Vanrija pseudolonga TaxID=143232 RepID=A0AAF1BGZ9_9TREE|nr:hypothetical protein LOC62_03G003993 [Vanrija pseudolonga]
MSSSNPNPTPPNSQAQPHPPVVNAHPNPSRIGDALGLRKLVLPAQLLFGECQHRAEGGDRSLLGSCHQHSWNGISDPIQCPGCQKHFCATHNNDPITHTCAAIATDADAFKRFGLMAGVEKHFNVFRTAVPFIMAAGKVASPTLQPDNKINVTVPPIPSILDEDAFESWRQDRDNIDIDVTWEGVDTPYVARLKKNLSYPKEVGAIFAMNQAAVLGNLSGSGVRALVPRAIQVPEKYDMNYFFFMQVLKGTPLEPADPRTMAAIPSIASYLIDLVGHPFLGVGSFVPNPPKETPHAASSSAVTDSLPFKADECLGPPVHILQKSPLWAAFEHHLGPTPSIKALYLRLLGDLNDVIEGSVQNGQFSYFQAANYLMNLEFTSWIEEDATMDSTHQSYIIASDNQFLVEDGELTGVTQWQNAYTGPLAQACAPRVLIPEQEYYDGRNTLSAAEESLLAEFQNRGRADMADDVRANARKFQRLEDVVGRNFSTLCIEDIWGLYRAFHGDSGEDMPLCTSEWLEELGEKYKSGHPAITAFFASDDYRTQKEQARQVIWAEANKREELLGRHRPSGDVRRTPAGPVTLPGIQAINRALSSLANFTPSPGRVWRRRDRVSSIPPSDPPQPPPELDAASSGDENGDGDDISGSDDDNTRGTMRIRHSDGEEENADNVEEDEEEEVNDAASPLQESSVDNLPAAPAEDDTDDAPDAPAPGASVPRDDSAPAFPPPRAPPAFDDGADTPSGNDGDDEDDDDDKGGPSRGGGAVAKRPRLDKGKRRSDIVEARSESPDSDLPSHPAPPSTSTQPPREPDGSSNPQPRDTAVPHDVARTATTQFMVPTHLHTHRDEALYPGIENDTLANQSAGVINWQEEQRAEQRRQQAVLGRAPVAGTEPPAPEPETTAEARRIATVESIDRNPSLAAQGIHPQGSAEATRGRPSAVQYELARQGTEAGPSNPGVGRLWRAHPPSATVDQPRRDPPGRGGAVRGRSTRATSETRTIAPYPRPSERPSAASRRPRRRSPVEPPVQEAVERESESADVGGGQAATADTAEVGETEADEAAVDADEAAADADETPADADETNDRGDDSKDKEDDDRGTAGAGGNVAPGGDPGDDGSDDGEGGAGGGAGDGDVDDGHDGSSHHSSDREADDAAPTGFPIPNTPPVDHPAPAPVPVTSPPSSPATPPRPTQASWERATPGRAATVAPPTTPARAEPSARRAASSTPRAEASTPRGLPIRQQSVAPAPSPSRQPSVAPHPAAPSRRPSLAPAPATQLPAYNAQYDAGPAHLDRGYGAPVNRPTFEQTPFGGRARLAPTPTSAARAGTPRAGTPVAAAAPAEGSSSRSHLSFPGDRTNSQGFDRSRSASVAPAPAEAAPAPPAGGLRRSARQASVVNTAPPRPTRQPARTRAPSAGPSRLPQTAAAETSNREAYPDAYRTEPKGAPPAAETAPTAAEGSSTAPVLDLKGKGKAKELVGAGAPAPSGDPGSSTAPAAEEDDDKKPEVDEDDGEKKLDDDEAEEAQDTVPALPAARGGRGGRGGRGRGRGGARGGRTATAAAPQTDAAPSGRTTRASSRASSRARSASVAPSVAPEGADTNAPQPAGPSTQPAAGPSNVTTRSSARISARNQARADAAAAEAAAAAAAGPSNAEAGPSTKPDAKGKKTKAAPKGKGKAKAVADDEVDDAENAEAGPSGTTEPATAEPATAESATAEPAIAEPEAPTTGAQPASAAEVEDADAEAVEAEMAAAAAGEAPAPVASYSPGPSSPRTRKRSSEPEEEDEGEGGSLRKRSRTPPKKSDDDDRGTGGASGSGTTAV